MKKLVFLILFICTVITCANAQDETYYENGELLIEYADLGYLGPIKILVENRGADVNYMDFYGVTPLMYAAQSGHDSVVMYLISKSADVNAESPDFKFSPLISAVKNDYLRTAEILIRNGADIDDQDVFGRTALHYAAIYGFESTADMLLYYDASVDIADVTGYTPLCYSVQNKSDSITMLLKLFDANGDITLRDSSNLFHIAAGNGNMFFLKTFEPDLKMDKNIYGLTPLEMSLLGGQSEVLTWFMEKGYSIKDTINGVYTARTLARISKDPKTKKIVRKSDIKDINYLYLNKIGVGFDMIFNGDDFFMSTNAMVTDARYGFVLESGIMFRGGERRILFPFEEDSFYQLREKRNGFYVKLDKNVKLFKTGASSYLSLFGGVRATYYWGKYDGLQMKVIKQMIASPSLGLTLNSDQGFRFFFMCDYLNLPVYNTNPLFYSVGFKALIDFRKKETDEKYKYIIKY